MIDALEQLRMMSSRIEVTPPGSLSQDLPAAATQEELSDPELHTCRHVVFGNKTDPVFLDRTFNPQEMEEARALLVANHRSFRDSETVKVLPS